MPRLPTHPSEHRARRVPAAKTTTTKLLPVSLGCCCKTGRSSAPDYNLLRKRGWTARWTARKVTGNNTYPSINHGRKILPVARVILDARKDEKVRYRDGDRLNLTRENLSLRAKGGAEINASRRRCRIAPVVSRIAPHRETAGADSRDVRTAFRAIAVTQPVLSEGPHS